MSKKDMICPKCDKPGFTRADVFGANFSLKCEQCGEWSNEHMWEPLLSGEEYRAALTTAREENERLKGELKEAREGLAARVHRNLNTDIDALVSENATLRAAVQGKTFFHSDEEVNAEMGRLRAKVERYERVLHKARFYAASRYEAVTIRVAERDNILADIDEALKEAE